MDFFTMYLAFSAVFGLASMDAMINADNVRFELTVSRSAEQMGYNLETTEEIFLHEIRSIVSQKAFLVPETLKANRHKGMTESMIDWLGWQDLPMTLKSMLSMDALYLHGALIDEDGKHRIVMLGNTSVSASRFEVSVPVTTDIESAIKQAAVNVVKRIDPYRTVLYLMTISDPKDPEDPFLVEAEQIALKQRFTSDIIPSEAQEALFANLLGVMSLARGDLETASMRLSRTKAIFVRFHVAGLNMALVQALQGRPDEAIQTLETVVLNSWIMPPELLLAKELVYGITLWKAGRLDEAEKHFASVSDVHTVSPEGHYYRALVLRDMGRLREAAIEERQFRLRISEIQINPDIAVLYFWVDVNGDPVLVRRSTEDRSDFSAEAISDIAVSGAAN